MLFRSARSGNGLQDPVTQPGHSGVHPRMPGFCTADSPAHDAGQEEPSGGLLADQGAPRVALGDKSTPSGGVGAPWLQPVPIPEPQGQRRSPGWGPSPHALTGHTWADTSHLGTSVSSSKKIKQDSRTMRSLRPLSILPLAVKKPTQINNISSSL